MFFGSNNEKNENLILINEKPKGKYNSKSNFILLEDNVINDITLIVRYYEENNTYITTVGFSYIAGYLLGFD